MDGLLTKEHSCNYIACQTTLTSGVAPINFITNRLIGFNFLSLSIEMHKWKWMVPDHGDVHFALIGENICGKLVTQIIISAGLLAQSSSCHAHSSLFPHIIIVAWKHSRERSSSKVHVWISWPI
ncbi:uncharacterized protein LOC120294923 isoform X2 [Eucalyptus grandis]|uniref:uncharacterized protein LOC120294923 isoform X2 n=1 Tax=Eucalyptus grandis TaxID=71139 RepID=UPI00192EF76E|nr:uncharacterized protein LOC120294923 isoform X2 [Eucalyptus grandis]